MDAERIQAYGRFLSAKQYTSSGSQDIGIRTDDPARTGPATQEEANVVVTHGGRPRELVQLVRTVFGSDTVWTARNVMALGGESGQGVSDALERARAEGEKRRRLIEAIENLGKLADGWAGEGSVAPSEKAIKDARLFATLVPEGIPEPMLCAADDGEILIDWALADKKVVVGLEGDGCYGYALYRGGRYNPGKQEGDLSTYDLPSDLKAYLQSMQ